MKETLLFSNIVAKEDIFCNPNSDCSFIPYMEDLLISKLNGDYNLLFISAPGLGGEENYLKVILKCFEKINISFNNVLELKEETNIDEVNRFIKQDNLLIFLMGGNPITQFDIIKKNKLTKFIKDFNGLVIGFCAGAINLSKYSIITTDEDFKIPSSYRGINRVCIVVEPHYNPKTDNYEDYLKRDKEILDFANKYKTTIFAIPDTSMLVVYDNNIINEYGQIYKFSTMK